MPWISRSSASSMRAPSRMPCVVSPEKPVTPTEPLGVAEDADVVDLAPHPDHDQAVGIHDLVGERHVRVIPPLRPVYKGYLSTQPSLSTARFVRQPAEEGGQERPVACR